MSEDPMEYSEHITEFINAFRFWVVAAFISDDSDSQDFNDKVDEAIHHVIFGMSELCNLIDVPISCDAWYDMLSLKESGE